MPPKAVLAANILAAIVITSKPLGTQGNTSIAKLSKQSIEWYREIITQLINN